MVANIPYHGSQGGHLSEDADGSLIPVRLVSYVHPVVVKGAQRTNDADHDGHRVRVVVEAVEETYEVLAPGTFPFHHPLTLTQHRRVVLGYHDTSHA